MKAVALELSSMFTLRGIETRIWVVESVRMVHAAHNAGYNLRRIHVISSEGERVLFGELTSRLKFYEISFFRYRNRRPGTQHSHVESFFPISPGPVFPRSLPRTRDGVIVALGREFEWEREREKKRERERERKRISRDSIKRSYSRNLRQARTFDYQAGRDARVIN